MRYVHNEFAGAWALSDAAVEVFLKAIADQYPDTEAVINDHPDLLVHATCTWVDPEEGTIELIVAECLCDDYHEGGPIRAFAQGAMMPGGLKNLDLAMAWFEESSKGDPSHPQHAEWLEKDRMLERVTSNEADELVKMLQNMLGDS